MRRILVLGDIHIGDYPRYNNIANRLGQFDRLANRLCERVEGDQLSDVSDVIIAGDLLLSCVMKPKAVHCVKIFIEKLCNRFENVYYVLGNHDVDVKLRKFYGQEDETLVTLLDNIPNFKYMHNKHEIIEGVDFYFMDWIKGSEVPLKEKSDIFISHINLMPNFGQIVDNTLFKLGIFGDYHARFQNQNMITTGTPIQHYISDPIEPGVLIVDVDNGQFKWNRYPIENEKYQFLKIYREREAPSPLGRFDAVVKSIKIEKKPEFEKLRVSLDSKLDTILEERGLKDIHTNVLNVTGDIEPIDMNFELKKLDVLDFRSIKELHVRFDEDKLMFLNGANGSGKTSFILALRVALFGDRSIKRYIRHGCTYTEVGIELLYQGRIHSIARAPGYLSYKIDDKQQDANNMASMQGMIERNLPFLGYLGDFLINSHTTFFSSCNRLGLISRLFGLDRYSMYATEANKQKNQLECDTRRSIELETVKINSEIEAKVKHVDSLKALLSTTDLSDTDFGKLDSEINRIETELGKVGALEAKIAGYESDSSSIEELESKLSLTKDKTEKVLNEIRRLNDRINQLNDLRNFESQLSKLCEIQSQSTHTAKCENCGSFVTIDLTSDDIVNKIRDLKVRIEDLKSNLVNCDINNLKSELNAKNGELISLRSEANAISVKINAVKSKLADESKLNAILTEIGNVDEVNSKLADLRKIRSQAMEWIRTKTVINSTLNEIEGLKLREIELSSKLEKCKVDIEKYNRYLEMFSFSNKDGIPYQTLNMVVSSISDEEITFTTDKELSSGKTQFRVSCTMNVDGNDLDFDDLSDGQQAFVSLKVLSKLTKCLPGLGLVMLDEPLKHVDEGRINQCINLIKDIQSHHIILSSHSPSFNYADRVLTFSLDDGVTNVVEES